MSFGQTLYLEGARTVVVMDVFPKGCYPIHLWNVSAPEELSEDGCWIPAMNVIEAHNAGLQVTVANLNAELTGANVIIFSLYDVIMSAIRNPSKYGELSRKVFGWDFQLNHANVN